MWWSILQRCMYGSKLKTNKAVARRFLEIAPGEFAHLASGTNHNTGKKSCRQKNRLRGLQVCSAHMNRYVRRLLR